MKKILVLLIALSLLTSCGQKLTKKKIANYKQEGLYALQQGEYQTAIEALSQILEYDDENNTIAYALVDAYVGAEDFNKAIRTLEKIKNSDPEKIFNLITLYKGSNLLKDIAKVDWETYKNKDWTYVGAFNDDYFKYAVGKQYGLLDTFYDVALEALYADVSYWPGPYDGLITAYRTELEAVNNDQSKLVLFDRNLKETKKKFATKTWGTGYPKEPFIDIFSGNQLSYVDVYKVEGVVKADIRAVFLLDRDKVVAGALRENDGDSFNLRFENEFYLVNKKDLSLHRLQGKAKDHFYGYYPDGSIANDMITMEDKGKCGYYNMSAILVSSFIYDGEPQADRSYRCNSYSHGYVVVKFDGKYGLMDKNGNLVVKAEFDSITDIAYGSFLVIYQGRIGLAQLK